MKVRNIDLIGIVRTLEEYSGKKLPQKISFAITKNLIGLNKDVECYSKTLEKILDKYKDYIVKDEKGETINNENGLPLVDKDHIIDYGNELSELLNIEIDINIYKVDISVFDYNDSDKYDSLSAVDIIKLQSILCDQSDEDKNDEKVE